MAHGLTNCAVGDRASAPAARGHGDRRTLDRVSEFDVAEDSSSRRTHAPTALPSSPAWVAPRRPSTDVAAEQDSSRAGVIRCEGVLVGAAMRSVAAVITITGRLDASSVNAVAGHLARFVCLEAALILDVSGLEADAELLLHLLSLFNAECHWGGIEWVLVDDHAEFYLDQLSPAGGHGAVGATSVANAHSQCASFIRSRRTLPLFD